MVRRTALLLGFLLLAGASVDAALGQSKKTADLIKLLHDKNPKTRQSAADDIAELATVKLTEAQYALPTLRDLLKKDPEPSVRKAALEAVGKIEPERYADTLVDAVKKEKEPEFRLAVVAELGKLGPRAKDALPALHEVLKNPPEIPRTPSKAAKTPPPAGTADPSDPQAVRKAIVPVLRLIDPAGKDHLPLFLEVLKKDRDAGLRTVVVTAVGQMGKGVAKEALPGLQEALKTALQEASKAPPPSTNPAAPVEPPALLRQSLLTAIGVMAPPTDDYLPLLIDTLKKERDPAPRLTAATAIARLGPAAKTALPVLLDAYKSSVALSPAADSQGARKATLEAVGAIDREPKTYLPVLTDVLKKDRDPAVLVVAITEVGKLGLMAKVTLPLVKEAQRQALAAAPTADATGLRKAALEAQGKIDPEPKALVGMWLDVLQKDRDPELRRTAVLALGKLGATAKPAAPTLTEIVRVSKLSANEADRSLAIDAEAALKAIKEAKP